ncbi:succinate-semialdehyde dehydrogenase/glutarate-semialdehyde dehydrogenase [Erwinia toletana]|uniref:Succinate-semialdehyde dehydrogenase/glutarate-semialdehyde dehydrogenase n=1 Tax=Winslowiella toletana TaxID=92490 RepID=A0ABS4PF93_9GAMM|nr:NAD-dependent succinate-semialdehyde dehydrogenase [Winslowiella toletana]MBP2171305.1 succinate-semialdehyde dehydrogenase/glutarate-semialdehyde dehydrogenase [Winslowiella toletana]
MIKVINPADGSVVGETPMMSAEEVAAAIDRTCAAFPAWAEKTAQQRSDILRRWYDLVRADKRVFAEIMVKENGKCLSEAMGEIDYGLGFIEWYAEEAKRVYGDTIPSHDVNASILVVKEPLGPTAAITPWNFPFMMITRKIATALAAGCTMIIKPAEETPLTAWKLLEYAREAGIPAGVFEMVTGDPQAIGEAFASDTRIHKVSFTGSTRVGKLLASNCGAALKKMTLELGGNAPFIVFDDATLNDAVSGLISAKLRNSGQVCISPNRVLVQDGIYQQFAEQLTAAVANIRVDQGMQDEFVVGPLINQQAVDKVTSLVDDAVSRGATVHLGGKRDAKGGLFYQPTILGDLDDSFGVHNTEIFGPVFALYRFSSEEEAIRRANNTEYGLVAYAWTRDLGRAFRLSKKLEAGMVIINSASVGTASVPFGGIKQSGYGREGGHYGIEEYMQVKYVLMAGQNR